MSIEVEIKLKIQKKEQIKDILMQSGFVEGKTVTETDTYYTSAHHDFWKLDEALRIRSIRDLTTQKETAVITYKGAKLDQISMTRKELETEVGEAAVMREILERIGFSPVLPVEKQRRYLHKGNITACLDEVKDLGDYLELEILTDTEENRETALQKIEEILKLLGYSMQETTRRSYLSMLMSCCERSNQ